MLTNAIVRSARPKARAYKLADGGGLVLAVAPTGAKAWRWRFRWDGREQLLTIGSYPETSLDSARAARDQARDRRARGEDPRTPSLAASAPSTFEPAARAWLAHRRAGWAPVHAADNLASLERDVFPALGAIPLADIKAPLVLEVLEAIEARGSIETARRVRERIDSVFAFACSKGWAETNPAAGVGEAMAAKPPSRRLPALEDAGELRALLAAIDALVAAPAVKRATRFLALTAVRFACVRLARWREIEGLDGPAPTWRIPAAHMKLAAAKKLDAANDHLVPLSPAAVDVLRAARVDLHCHDANLHDAALIFPGRAGDPCGEKAIEILHHRAGYAGRHVPHGWRASFSTLLNEAFPEERGTIDRAIAHAGGRDEKALGINAKVEGAYNRSTHMPRRRWLFEAWAAILAGGAPSCFDSENPAALAIAA